MTTGTPAIGPRLPLVLIVDDHVDALQMYTDYLGASGFDTCGTSTAMHAIELAVTRRPDVVLTDIQMPFVDGWTILRTLSEHPLTKSTPVVVISGDADALTHTHADRCAALLTKPCPPRVMVEALRAVLASANRSSDQMEDAPQQSTN